MVPVQVSVLIIEDDPTLRVLLRLACREEGWDVREAETGPAGLRALRACTQGRVVVLDARLPTREGTGVLQAVASEPALRRRHAFVLLTDDTTALPPDLRALARAWAIPIFATPFDLDELMDAIERAGERLTPRARP